MNDFKFSIVMSTPYDEDEVIALFKTEALAKFVIELLESKADDDQAFSIREVAP